MCFNMKTIGDLLEHLPFEKLPRIGHRINSFILTDSSPIDNVLGYAAIEELQELNPNISRFF